jgi:hypothetical protein
MNNNNNKNNIPAIETFTIPVVRYSYGVINWHQEEIQNLDRKTRKILTIYEEHHTKEDTDRIYVPRKEGGEE